MLQTLKRVAYDRKNFERQESDCLQKIRNYYHTTELTMWLVYRLQTGSVTHVGYQMRPRVPTLRRKRVPHIDVQFRKPPMGWITYKITHSEIHQETAETLSNENNQILYVRGIRGELIPSSLSHLPLRNDFSG